MNNKIFVFLVCICLSGSFAAAANESDSVKVKDDYSILIFSGLGVATDNSSWGSRFNAAPAMSLGLELPLNIAHNFALEFYGHTWYGKSSDNNRDYLDQYYFSHDNDYYSQLGLSIALKVYLGGKDSKFRLSGHLGGLILSVKKYQSIDLGFAAYYEINNEFNISLARRIMFVVGNLAGGTFQHAPNLYMLNVYYRINGF